MFGRWCCLRLCQLAICNQTVRVCLAPKLKAPTQSQSIECIQPSIGIKWVTSTRCRGATSSNVLLFLRSGISPWDSTVMPNSQHGERIGCRMTSTNGTWSDEDCCRSSMKLLNVNHVIIPFPTQLVGMERMCCTCIHPSPSTLLDFHTQKPSPRHPMKISIELKLPYRTSTSDTPQS